MRDKVGSGLDGPAGMVFGEVCCDVWFVFWCEIRYDMIELGVVWHSNFVNTCLDINSNSVKPWFLYKNTSVLCPHELRRECVMAFDLLTFWDRNQMLKLDIGELEE